jgi:hypothetical protein
MREPDVSRGSTPSKVKPSVALQPRPGLLRTSDAACILMRGCRIRADADHLGTQGADGTEVIAEAARLDGTSGSAILGVEIEDDRPLRDERGQRNRLAVLVGQGENGRLFADQTGA